MIFKQQMFFVLLAGVLAIAGCGGSSDTRGERMPASGYVTVDSEPLQRGRIVFLCDQGDGQLKATATVMGGVFRFTKKTGPLTGTARVEVYPAELELEELEMLKKKDPGDGFDYVKVEIPAKFNTASTLTADVKEVAEDSNKNLYTFNLVTK